MKKRKAAKTVFTVIGLFLALIILFVGGFLVFAAATTLKVEDTAEVQICGSADTQIGAGTQISILTWNVGYGALDERQDCYWDGGKGVYGESEAAVRENIDAIKSRITQSDPDIVLLQEVDTDSKRSYYINELDAFKETFKEEEYNITYAENFKAGMVPLPVSSPTGKVEAGISTFSKYSVSSAERVQLPVPFSWPMSMFNLKRCLLINRIPVSGRDKELVLINLHLEAYDDGEGKAKQLGMLTDIMQAEYDKGNYVVAGGDFNQTFSNTDYKKYPKLNDWVCPVIEAEKYPSFSFLMDDTYPTCRSLYKPYADSDKNNHQYYMIDGFIVSNNITVDRFETIDYGFKNTDHNPVILSIILK